LGNILSKISIGDSWKKSARHKNALDPVKPDFPADKSME
jgi:hypothetical protein